ncbi:MAG: hypothetical protein A3D87_03350 [Omnitrophica WOR_2 bacterium RIFCSPHIGHO2_02_FULL_50_17]|nr:MAG: hypothetical protein A3D87_03350 [Omnitrophica WOR_2 bacterium RIFCSPHIGHO2_02_FULL_50_17]
MKVALIEVKPIQNEYIAKEMAGGLGKRITLGNNFWATFLRNQLTNSFIAPPISLASLAGVAMACNHGIKAYHIARIEDIERDTDIAIVLSSMVDYHNEVNFIRGIKTLLPRLKVIVVGSFASAMPEIYAGEADCIIKGDSELAVQKILSEGFPVEKIIVSERPEDLNTLPMLNWEPFMRNGYYARRPFSKELGVGIQKSRGCSMTCNYCPYAAFYGKARHFDSDYVLKMLEHYHDRHQINYFMFRDPNFGENRKEFHVFMEKLINSGLKINWSCEARLDTFKEDSDFGLMAKAGLRYIITGIESSDEELLKQNLRRPIKKEDAFRKLKVLERSGVIVQTNYILGFPHETQESVYKTIEYAKQLNSMFATFHVFTPQPGTKIFDDYKNRLLGLDWQEFNYSNLVWGHDTLTKDFLDKITSNAYVEYYFRPKWMLKHTGRLLKTVF